MIAKGEKLGTAVRMVGHLLEHHPTTGEAARTIESTPTDPCSTGAACWCYLGAIEAVTGWNGLEFDDVYDESSRQLGLSCASEVEKWEGKGTSKKSRLTIARKLQNYGK